MVVLAVVDNNIGGIGAYILIVPLVNFLVLPGIVPGNLDIAGFAKLTRGGKIDGKVLYQDVIVIAAGGLGRFTLVYLEVDIDLAGLLALQEQGHGAKRLCIFSSLGSGNDGLYILGHRLGVAVGTFIFNIEGAGARRHAQIDGLTIGRRDGLLEHIETLFLALGGNGVCNAGRSHHDCGTCQKHLQEFSHSY